MFLIISLYRWAYGVWTDQMIGGVWDISRLTHFFILVVCGTCVWKDARYLPLNKLSYIGRMCGISVP